MDTLILLATYNGSHFLKEQLDSIYSQSYGRDWQLLIRDDVSSDASMEILQAYSTKYKNAFIIKDGLAKLGAKGNFSRLLDVARGRDAGCYCLADQDDVWRPDKLASQVEFIRELTRVYPDKPLLVYSDLEVVDSSLYRLHRSFMRYQGIRHEDMAPLEVLLAQNFVTGCTIMINRQLLEVAVPIPEEALMHDWWLALCAASLGHIAYIDRPLVKYRQHGNNEVGAKRIGYYFNPISTNLYRHWLEGRENLQRSMVQARALAQRIRLYDPSNPNLEQIDGYASLAGLAPRQRLRALRSMGIHAQSGIRHALLLSRLLFLRSIDSG